MQRTLIAIFVAIALLSASAAAATAQTPAPTATFVPTDEARPAPQSTPTAAAVMPQPATPLPESGLANALAGYVVQDTDGNGVQSAGDKPAETLVEMLVASDGYLDGGALLKTDSSGRFEFADLTPGDYELTIWWSPGYVSIQGAPVTDTLLYFADAGILKLKVTLGSDGKRIYAYATSQYVDGRFRLGEVANAPAIPSGDLVILVKPKPEGLIPFPVSDGEGQQVIPIGRASLSRISLPASGAAGDRAGISEGWLLVGVGAILLIGTTVLLYAETRFKHRQT